MGADHPAVIDVTLGSLDVDSQRQGEPSGWTTRCRSVRPTLAPALRFGARVRWSMIFFGRKLPAALGPVGESVERAPDWACFLLRERTQPSASLAAITRKSTTLAYESEARAPRALWRLTWTQGADHMNHRGLTAIVNAILAPASGIPHGGVPCADRPLLACPRTCGCSEGILRPARWRRRRPAVGPVVGVPARSGHHVRAIEHISRLERMSGGGRRRRSGDGERRGPNCADEHMSKADGEHIDSLRCRGWVEPSVPEVR